MFLNSSIVKTITWSTTNVVDAFEELMISKKIDNKSDRYEQYTEDECRAAEFMLINEQRRRRSLTQ